MIIYKITNKLNGKSYIGQTRKTVAERLKSHIQGRSKIGKAMLKDGVENFDISVIDNAETQEELDQLERFWIAFYNVCDTGYNTLIGGKPTKEEFKLLSKISASVPKTRKKRRRQMLLSQKESVERWLEQKTSGYIGRLKYISDKVFYSEYIRVFGSIEFPFPESGKLSRIQRKYIKYYLLKQYAKSHNKPLYFANKYWSDDLYGEL